MNIEQRQFDPAPTEEGPGGPAPVRRISPVAFGWIAAAAIILGYVIGSSLVLGLFADGVSISGIEITTPDLFTASIIAQVLFLLFPVLIFAYNSPLGMREALRLRPSSVSFFLLSAFGVMACRILGGAWLIFQGTYLVPDSMREWYREAQSGAEWLGRHLFFGPDVPMILFALLAVAAVPALSEELVFRGIIQRHFEERMKPAVAILLSATIFGAIHWQPTNFVPLAGVGAFLGLVAWASRSIWPAVFGHFLFNGLQIVVSNLTEISLDELERSPTRQDLYALLPVALVSLIALASIVRGLLRLREGEAAPSLPSSGS